MRSWVPAQTDAGSGRHPKDWAPQTEGGGSPHGLADPYLSTQRQSPRPCGLPRSLPRRAPRPARLPRAEITELRPAAPRLQAALAPPPAAAPGARSLVEPCGPPPAPPNQSPGLSPGSGGEGPRRAVAPNGHLPLRRDRPRHAPIALL
uniref:Uncharacterized protein n=1 Tax=Rangifer tarandus platyrhynchus TaxID=3082113 RepID=A0ACB0EM23_RANTA|nr:unnamed protein product [Rangifer tarandus platyrhynchus]